MNKTLTRSSDALSEAIVSYKLFNLFAGMRDKEFYFIEPGGNYGDQLIYKGAYKLARLAGIKFTPMNYAEFLRKEFDPREVIYIHGGGGFVPWWSGTVMKVLKRLSAEFEGIVILGPTTFFDDAHYTETALSHCLAGNRFREFYVFTRDKLSYETLKKYLPGKAEIICDHDTALNLVRSDLVSGEPSSGKYILYAMRSEKERPASQPYNYLRWLDPIDVCFSFEKWLKMHVGAKKLITNRTHSTIVGSILGIPTVMLPNSYHKNRSVWEYSLRARGVEWRDHLDCGLPGINALIERVPLLRKGFTCDKYRKMMKLRLNALGF